MSIFGSLIGAIPTAARWLIGNSGVIGDVVGTIAKVAGVATVQDEDGTFILVPQADCPSDCPGGGHSVQSLQKNIQKAAKVLDDVAGGVQKPEEGEGDVKSAKMNVLWTEPSTTVSGVPSTDMYRDLAMMLREKDIPLSFSDSAGNPLDVPYRLAQAMFANAGAKGTIIQIDEKTAIEHTDLRIPSKHNECVINARHAYYRVPMGKGGDDFAWHAALHLNRSETPEFAARYRRKQEDLFYISRKNPPTGPVWVVTVTIDWTTVLMAENAHKRLETELRETSDYYVSFSNVEANLQIVKLVARSEEAPQQVRAKVEVAVNKIIKAVANPSLNLLDTSSDYPTGQGGKVLITTQEFLGEYAGTSDYRMAMRRLAAESARVETKHRKDMEYPTKRQESRGLPMRNIM